MGNYINSGLEGFVKDINSQIYVDKTGLIKEMNYLVNDSKNCIALSHARRFGKSQAAGMLDAYYSCGYDSRQIFEALAIAKEPGWDKYLNKFNVLHLEIATLVNNYGSKLVPKLKQIIYAELAQMCPNIIEIEYSIAAIMKDAYAKTGIKFVVIIDEWDCVIRNYARQTEFVHTYMQFLHDIFKSKETESFLALGYITGILPIKKIKDESALNNFREYTMLNSGRIAQYFGFTDDEVRVLCNRYEMDYEAVNKWYNGYIINGLHMYNPNSVYQAMLDNRLDSYWKNTSSFEAINTYITFNKDGLKNAVLKMLAGEKVSVNVKNFQNDLSIINSTDDAMTALIHLGYLGYDERRKKAFIPNYEVSTAFMSAIETGKWHDIGAAMSNADELLFDTIDGVTESVAQKLDIAHEAYASIIKYNDENSMSCVLTMAYMTAPAYYNIERELPSGKGFADLVFIPRRDSIDMPAMVIELKYDKSADTAIKQIKEKRYYGHLSGYADRILLVGINYDKSTKRHECIIEEYNSAKFPIVSN